MSVTKRRAAAKQQKPEKSRMVSRKTPVTTNSANGEMQVSVGEYKGYPMLCGTRGENDRFPIQLGVKKVKFILDNLAAARQFVADNS